MEHFTITSVLRMCMELSLGISIKLFCDNGRIHWRDFANDLLFWIPGVQRLAGDGLTRQVEAMIPPMAFTSEEAAPMALAAK